MSNERWDEIVRWVDDEGRVPLGALASRFRVSEMTIRRDLDALTAEGRLRRVRGGAVSLTTPAPAPVAPVPAPDDADQSEDVLEDGEIGESREVAEPGEGDGAASGALPSPALEDLRAPSSLGSVIASWAGRFPGGFPTSPQTVPDPVGAPTATTLPMAAEPRPEPRREAQPVAAPGARSSAGAPTVASGGGDPWERAAAAACRGLAAGSAVLLTGGEGSLALAHHLAELAAHSPGPVEGAGGPALTVAATALAPAAVLAGSPGVRLVLLGGEAEAAGHDLVGPAALAALDDLHLDLALLTPTGIDARGAWAPTSSSAALLAAAVARATRTVAVVGSAALGRPGLVRAAARASLAQVVAVPSNHDDPRELAARLASLRAAAPTAPDVVAA